MPVGPDMRLFRRLRFGDLLDLHLLDSRQYRTDQPDDFSTPAGREQAPRDFRPGLPPGGNPGGTLLGTEQERWLLDGLRQSPTRWNALGNQVMMAEFNFGHFEPPSNGGPLSFNVDSWDGYGAERSRILAAAAADPDLNLVVLTGDAHSAWVHDLEADFGRPGHPVATEFVGTSITSAFPPSLWPATEKAARLSSPWTHYLDGRRRGYAICTVTREEWRTDFRMVDSSPDQGQVLTPDAGVETAASFVVERGQAGANRA
jgi:alkaline phosphatase D